MAAVIIISRFYTVQMYCLISYIITAVYMTDCPPTVKDGMEGRPRRGMVSQETIGRPCSAVG